MKRLNFKHRPTLLALALLASPLLQAQMFTPNTGTYLGISAGESKSHIDNARITQGMIGSGVINNLSEDSWDKGYKAYVGMPFDRNWAAEVGYFDLGRFGFKANTTPSGSLTGTARIRGLNLDVVGTLPMTERWSLMGRVGVAYAQNSADFSGTGAVVVASPSISKYETNFKYGLGTQYDFTPALSLRLEAERYRVNDAVGHRGDADLVSLGLLYRFGGPMAPTKSVYKPYVAPIAAPAVVVPIPPPVVVPVAPPASPAPKPWAKVKLAADSLFGFDRDTLQPEGKQALDKLIAELKSVNVEAVQVTGHIDRLGSKAHNAQLSLRRAEAVRDYLVQAGGISASKVTATGVGSSQPEHTGDCTGIKPTPALINCLQMDRRVEVEVMGSQ